MLDKLVSETRFAAAKSDEERRVALEAARDAAARFPLSTVAVAHYIDLLNRSNQHQQAIETLRTQAAITRTQPAYYALLGRSYEALGKQSLHHQSIGEMYALLGIKPAALQQMELARRANDGDFYTMSEIDARVRELQADILREQEAMRAERTHGPGGQALALSRRERASRARSSRPVGTGDAVQLRAAPRIPITNVGAWPGGDACLPP